MTHTPERRRDYATRIEVSLIRYRLRTGKIGAWQAEAKLRALGVSLERIGILLGTQDVSDAPTEPARADVTINRLFSWIYFARIGLLDLQTQILLVLVDWISIGSQRLVKALSLYGLRGMARRGELSRDLRSPHRADIDAAIGIIGVIGLLGMIGIVIADNWPGIYFSELIASAMAQP